MSSQSKPSSAAQHLCRNHGEHINEESLLVTKQLCVDVTAFSSLALTFPLSHAQSATLASLQYGTWYAADRIVLLCSNEGRRCTKVLPNYYLQRVLPRVPHVETELVPTQLQGMG